MTYSKTYFIKMLRSVYNIVDTLKSHIEQVSNDIEPYEGRSELTEAQSQRQEWLDDAASICQEFLDGLDGVEGI